MGGAGGTCATKKNMYRVLVGNLRERDHLKILLHRLEYILDIKRIGGQGIDSSSSGQGLAMGPMNTVVNLWVPRNV
jgi:hypothetical protein